MTSRIAALLRPRAIAIVGASQAANKMAGQVIPALVNGGYGGNIYPVNPRYDEVAGLRCYASLAEAPDDADHCIVAVARERVLGVVEECRRKGIAGASIFSSGYAEAGDEEGRAAQDALRRAAGDMLFIGPNCMGFANLVDRVIAAPSTLLRRDPEPGDVALLSQSGGVGFATLNWFARERGLRFSHLVNTGNSAGVSYRDLVAFMFDEPAVRVLLVVAESERAVAECVEAVRERGLVKPIVLFKLGRGATGARMALSHTGSLAGDWRLIRDCAEQHGIVCVDDVEEALGCAELLRMGLSARHADGLAAISISGGNVTMFADQADANGLSFAHLSEATEEGLRGVLPSYISVHNPIDITALGYEDPSLHGRVLDVLATDAAVRTVVPIITVADDYTPVTTQLAACRRRGGAAMIVLWTGGAFETRSHALLRETAIPVFHSAGALARSLLALRRAEVAEAAAPVQGEAPALPHGGALTESESMAFLQAGGVPVPPVRRCHRMDVLEAAKAVGYPVVVKADSSDTHISDAGGVLLDLGDADALVRAAPRMLAWPGTDVVVSRFMPGLELVASAFTHPALGRVMMLGSGGQFVELQADIGFVALPASGARIAAVLLRTTVGQALHRGARGATGFDAAVDLLCALGALAVRCAATVAQIECNPVTVGRHGAVAVDAAVTAR